MSNYFEGGQGFDDNLLRLFIKYKDNFFVNDLEGEYWKDVPDYEGFYVVSNLGRIKGLVREIDMSNGNTGLFYERIMAQRLRPSGYLCTELCKKGIRKHFLCHRIIALAFVDNPFNYEVVNHIDGCKTNNKISNLEWCSSGQNQEHAYKSGLKRPCYKNKEALTLRKEDAVVIRKRLENGELQKDIANDYKVTPATISLIKTGKRW